MKTLITLANELDQIGLFRIANELDNLVTAGVDKKHFKNLKKDLESILVSLKNKNFNKSTFMQLVTMVSQMKALV